jgi:hypothetical protein
MPFSIVVSFMVYCLAIFYNVKGDDDRDHISQANIFTRIENITSDSLKAFDVVQLPASHHYKNIAHYQQQQASYPQRSVQTVLVGNMHFNKIFTNTMFSFIYALLIVIVSLSVSSPNISIFTAWNTIGATEIVQLIATIVVTVAAPGYALLSIIDSDNKLGFLPKILISYLLSILVTGLIGYVAAYGAVSTTIPADR